MRRVLVTGKNFEPVYFERLRASGFEVTNLEKHLSEAELASALQGQQAYLLGGLEHPTEEVLHNAKDLQLIAFLGVGYESFVPYEAATRLGIAITNTPGAMVESVAELTIGHLIGLRRQITYLDQEAKSGQTIEERSWDLRGQTAGVIGLGAIGTRVAQILTQGFGMRVVYHSRTPKPNVERELHVRKVPLDELLASSDVVSLHVPLTPQTKHMIGARELAMMKSRALLVNTARAEAVDGHALYQALVAGKISGAAYDGYYIEPIPPASQDEWKLLSLSDKTFVVTPHIGSLTVNSWNRMTEMAIESIIAFFKTGADSHIVNPGFERHKRG